MTTPAGPVSFSSLGLPRELTDVVTALGYEEPTPVQRETIPLLLEGRDLLGQAATGTGKTAAFALPMLHRINQDRPGPRQTAGLVLVPTRELAMQVAEAVHKYAKGVRLSVLPLYGGAPMHGQIRELERGAQIVVATPGRALDHIRRGTLKIANLRVLVLDEADEMLDMGFAEELDAILKATPATRQTALFSATIPSRILSIAGQHLKNPARITIAREKAAAGKMPRVRQVAYIIARAHKPATLERILDMEDPVATLVFCRTRLEVESLVETCNAHGHRAEALHGGMMQKQRDRVMGLFRSQKANLLIATDVAARGLDIEHLSHVVNYDVPASPEVYLHRIGRTGRAGRGGTAITLAEPREQRHLRAIEQFTKSRLDVGKVPTVADLRTRRLELMRASLRERLVAADFDDVRVVVASLAEEFDPIDIAAAAVKMAHLATGGDAEEMTSPPPRRPSAPERHDRPDTAPPPRRPSTASGRPEFSEVRDRPATPSASRRPSGAEQDDKAPRLRRPDSAPSALRRAGPDRPGDREEREGDVDGDSNGNMVRLFIGAGRALGVRPGDLVGAITGEANVRSRSLGAIEIADKFSLVEVPEALADRIIAALKATKIRGNKVTVRRERTV
ncbi:MAG: DEAD/DEAH box helicase [Acidobacteria bacterium]|nr:DEAD/DEAH box helicase [Acidobacteriota bacterium]